MQTIMMNENLDKSDGLCTQNKNEDGGCKPLWWMKTLISLMASALEENQKTEDANHNGE